MSEIKLNLVDSEQILCGIVHAAVAERAVAALSAEPETIRELDLALDRYQKPNSVSGHFSWFQPATQVNLKHHGAGLMIIDLSARLVATSSTYSQPDHHGCVTYHDGEVSTDLGIPYRLSEDWCFLNTVESYLSLRDSRRQTRSANPPLDVRSVVYGPPLLEFIAGEMRKFLAELSAQFSPAIPAPGAPEQAEALSHEPALEPGLKFVQAISTIHKRWLATARDDLSGLAPREAILSRLDLIDFDMEMRELQWAHLGEGPPCLPTESRAYRFAAFGSHEWVIYYDLVRHLLWTAFYLSAPEDKDNSWESAALKAAITQESPYEAMATHTTESFAVSETRWLIEQLEQAKNNWLETPNEQFDGRTPANLIENERKRLPISLQPCEMTADDDCPLCTLMGEHLELGNEVGFWHLCGSNMDEGFVFSYHLTRAEWAAEQADREKFRQECEWESTQRNREKQTLETELESTVDVATAKAGIN